MIQLFIDEIDRTDYISSESIRYQQTLTKAPAILVFAIKDVADRTMPALGQSVLLVVDSVNVFRGTITERAEQILSGFLVEFTFSCKDNTHTFDRRLVAKSFVDTTSHEIFQSIVGNFTDGFTTSIQGDPVAMASASFNYEQPSKCVQILCNQIGYDWYIDTENVVHFFPKGNIPAPFEVTDTNGNAFHSSLVFESNIIELKNAVYIRGGSYLDSIAEGDSVDLYKTEGSQRSFVLLYRYKNIQVSVAGVAQAVGIDYIDNPAEYDCLYNYQEKAIKFRENNKPGNNQLVKIWGDAEIPLLIYLQDNDSIAQYGKFEAVKIDPNVTSIAEAELLAQSLLDEWALGSYEGYFETRTPGLRAGQSITINSTLRDINDTFRINRITAEMRGGEFYFRVQFIKSGNVDFTDIMVELLGRDKRNLVIVGDEIVQRILEITEDTFAFADQIDEVATDSPPYTYASGDNEGKWDFATWS